MNDYLEINLFSRYDNYFNYIFFYTLNKNV